MSRANEQTEGKPTNSTNVRIDWISATFKSEVHIQGVIPLSRTSPIDGKFGYDNCFKSADGVLVLQSTTRSDMGKHVVISASALDKIHLEHGATPIEVLTSIVHFGGKLTRLDLAMDVHDQSLNITELVIDYKAGDIITTARSGAVIITLGDNGQTLYVGKRGSRLFLRVYDKAAQLQVPGDWIRIELEMRKTAAIQAALILISSENWTVDVAPIIRGFCDFPNNPTWQKALGNRLFGITAPQQTEGETRKWLLNTCSTSIARLFHEGDTAILRDVMSRASDLIRETGLNKDH